MRVRLHPERLFGFTGIPNVTSGFRAYRSEALLKLDLEDILSKGFVFQVEILRRILDLPGASAAEVPIVFRNRAHGRSKLSGNIVKEGVLGVLKLASARAKGRLSECRTSEVLARSSGPLTRQLCWARSTIDSAKIASLARLAGARDASLEWRFRNFQCAATTVGGGSRETDAARTSAPELLKSGTKGLPEARGRRVDSPSLERAPRFSIVIPARPENSEPKALEALSRFESEPEVVVVRSSEPSRARNEAVRRTRGDWILFLDDDSEPEPDLLERYEDVIRKHPEVAAIGGPAILREGSSRVERISSAVFSEPWVVGSTASRYASRGALRSSDERELILCNLALSRVSFEALGGFNERLYPNEENELLERYRKEGALLLYDPKARVTRPAWSSWRSLFGSAYRYGRGRSRQWRCYRSKTSGLRLALLGLFGWGLSAALATALARPETALFAVGPLLFYVALLVVRFRARLSALEAIVASQVAVLTLLLYGSGSVVGLLFPWTSPRTSPLDFEEVSRRYASLRPSQAR